MLGVNAPVGMVNMDPSVGRRLPAVVGLVAKVTKSARGHRSEPGQRG
jgi:hypothetical protein